MAEQKHEVRIILRDWSKTKKGNAPVAETHTNIKRKETKMIEIKRLDAGIHSLAKVVCKDYNGNNVFCAEYLVTIHKLGDPENDTVQAILNDIEANKGNTRINTVTMYTEDDYGERHPFFEMDDCETMLFE